MQIAIRKEPNGTIYIDKNLKRGIDYTKSPYNFTITELSNSYSDCENTDFNLDLTFSIEKYNARHNKDLLIKELASLNYWFNEYDNQVKQYSRCQRLGIEFDKDIVALDNQAKGNAERITQIRNMLKRN